MERLQTIKQSKEGNWTREVEERIEGWVRGRVRRMGERQGETRGDVVRGAENAKKIGDVDGLLNVDLWVLRSPGLWPLPGRRDAKCHRFWLTDPAYIRN